MGREESWDLGRRLLYPAEWEQSSDFCVFVTTTSYQIINKIIYNGAKPKKFEIDFLGRKIDQYYSRVYQKLWNSNIWGGMFSKKSLFSLYFHEKIMILDF